MTGSKVKNQRQIVSRFTAALLMAAVLLPSSSHAIEKVSLGLSDYLENVDIASEDPGDYLTRYHSPNTIPSISFGSPLLNANSFSNEIGDAGKITYLTPRLSGFQIGVSFTPDVARKTNGSSPYASITDEGDTDETHSLSVNFENNFNDIKLKTSLGWQVITRTSADLEDTDELAAGLQLGYAGFSVGAAYKYVDNDSGTADLDRHNWNLGATYGMGPWKVGLQYASVSQDDAKDGDLHAVIVGGQYILGPGITAFGGVQFRNGESDREGSGGEDASILFVGTAINF